MEKIKIIDLLNKIAKGEKVPEKNIYNGNTYYNVGNEKQAYYENSELEDSMLMFAIYSESHLNDEVEIIEEDKKIEKLEEYSLDKDGKYEITPTLYEQILKNKINEIIDYINKENK